MMKTNPEQTNPRPTRREIPTGRTGRNPKSSRTWLGLLGAGMLLGGTAHAAPSLTAGTPALIGNGNSTQRALISVTPNAEGYSTGLDGGLTGGIDGTFDGTIVDYGFYNTTGTSSAIAEYAGKLTTDPVPVDVGLISTPTSSGANTSSFSSYLYLWDVEVPNVALDNEDYSVSTYGRPIDATGTIDISGLTAGSVYIFYGGNSVTTSISISMTDDDAILGAVSPAANPIEFAVGSNQYLVLKVDFADAADYETITYTYSHNSTNNKSRFGGVVLVEPGADNTAPAWTSGPAADTETLNGFTVRGTINEAGTAYYVVLPDGATAPSSAQVIAGTDASDVAATNGNFALTANTEGSDAVTGLADSTAYDVYVVAQDDEGTPNVQASPVLVNVSTLTPDSTPPVWAATYPKADTQTADGFTARAQIDEAGTAYYVVLADGATAPSSAQVIAGTDASDAAATASGSISLTADTEGSDVVTGLTYTPGISFDVYFVAEDLQSNAQASPVLVDWTPDTTAPTWTATYPLVDTPTEEGFTVRASIVGEDGTAYYVVLADAASAPSAAQVKAGTDASDAAALESGSIALTADVEGDAVLTGLAALTDYDVYIVAEDSFFVLTAPVLRDIATTAADVTAPNWTATYPLVDTVTSSGFTVRASIDENGTAYYVVVADGATAPTAEQIKLGNDASDVAALASGDFALLADAENSDVVTGLPDDTSYDIYIVAEDDAAALNTTAPVLREATTPVSTLTVGTGIQFNDNNPGGTPRTVSVFAGNSFVKGYAEDGTTERTLNMGTVSEYRFVNGSGTYASSGSRIGAVTADSTSSQVLIAQSVYTTVDPTSEDAADYTANTHVNGITSATGSIDVTGLTEGTLYFIYGTNGSRATSFVVSQGVSSVQIAGNDFWENTDTISAATPVSFTNDGTQNTITYSYTQTGAGKFMGVVLSTAGGPAEPTYTDWATTNVGGAAANVDTNGDGVDNGIAYFMNDAGVITLPGIVGGTITWINGGNIAETQYGTQFVVQTSPDLVTWTPVDSGDTDLANTSGSVAYTLPTGLGKLFVRLVVTPN